MAEQPPHRHLVRQLGRLGLNRSTPPSPEAWASFLDKVAKTYEDIDLERYTLERSLSLFEKEMRELNAKLEGERDRIRNVFQTASVGILRVEPDGRITMANPAMAAMLGYPEGELETLRKVDLLKPAERLNVQRSLWALIATRGKEAFRYQREMCRKDGSVIETNVSVSATWTADGKAVFATLIVEDQSEIARLEVELRHAQKLESVGRLASGIAHEINTPIQFVGDNAAFLQGAFSDILELCATYQGVLTVLSPHMTEEQKAQIEEAEVDADIEYVRQNGRQAFGATMEGVQRVSKIVKAMKAFAHPDQGAKTLADVNDALRGTLTVGNNELKYVADVVTDFGELPRLWCYLGDLNQVFLNLLVNAAHAIADAVTPEKGRGRIGVRTFVDGAEAVIAISDTGTGIPEAIRGKIFDPFFTTKEVGRGTGQGLAIARSIVEKHRGTLTFETALGTGTTFYVRLPLDRGSSSEAA